MKHSLKRFLSWMLVLSMVLGFIPAVHASGITWEKVDRPITADLFRQDVFEYTPGSELWLLDRRTTALEGAVRFSSANMVTDSAESHDLNGDGTTDADDADFLLEYALGNETALHGTGRTPTYSWRSIRRPLRSPSLPNRRPPWSVFTPVPRRTRACSTPWIGWIGWS